MEKEINNEKLLEYGFDEEMMLVDFPEIRMQFEKRKNVFYKEYEYSADKQKFLDESITNLEYETNIGYDKRKTKFYGRYGYELKKWGFNTVLKSRDLNFGEARKLLTNFTFPNILLKFSTSKEDIYFLKYKNEVYKNKKISDLNDSELWIEALSYILGGVADVEYFSFLKEFTIEHQNENLKKLEIEKEIDNGKPLPKKLKWTGTPAQFGFIINELIGKGYIEKPTGSYNKDAEFYFSIMDIDTTPGNLANEVNLNKNSFSANNARKFKIPSKDKLS